MEKDILKKEIHKFLSNDYVCALATSDDDGNISVSMVYYTVDHELNLYFMTREAMDKYKNIMSNPKVAFVVYNKDLKQTVQGKGEAVLLDKKNEYLKIKDRVLDIAYADQTDAFFPVMSLGTQTELVMFKIKLSEVKWLTQNAKKEIRIESLNTK